MAGPGIQNRSSRKPRTEAVPPFRWPVQVLFLGSGFLPEASVLDFVELTDPPLTAFPEALILGFLELRFQVPAFTLCKTVNGLSCMSGPCCPCVKVSNRTQFRTAASVMDFLELDFLERRFLVEMSQK